ncbi:MAG: dual specificity protein phosphatase family protein, partial [Mesorhizobium sp.]
MSDEVSPAAFYEEKAKNILKGELKRRGITYALLAEKLNERGAH